MLTWLRDNAKIFLIATIVIFVSLIFFRWGMGMGGGPPSNPYERAVAIVAGKDILPDEYSQALQSLNSQYRQQLQNMGNPDPDGMLLLMSQVLAEEAFDAMIDQRLESEHLINSGWKDFTVEQAASLLEAQVGLQDLGTMTAEEYIDGIMNEQPGLYEQYLYQTYVSGISVRFPVFSSLSGMTSRSEVDFLLLDTQGQISARYIYFDTLPPAPDEASLEEFYHSNPGLFFRPAGSLLRFVSVSILPEEEDIDYALDMVDSLAYSTQGMQVTAVRNSLLDSFGEDLALEVGRRTAPLPGPFSSSPSLSSYTVLLLDSVWAGQFEGEPSPTDDTLFLQKWEMPVLPGFGTIRSTMWRVEDQMEALLASEIPSQDDSLTLAGFGELLVDENTPLIGDITEELRVFATDTLWIDSIGPVFYMPSYGGGYPAFTVVRRLRHTPADSLTLEEALDSGYLHEMAYSHSRLEAAYSSAQMALSSMRQGGQNLGTWAAAESIEVFSIPAFSASQIRQNALADPTAAGGPLYSEEFATAALAAPDFAVIGPFRTGDGCFLAEILSRQSPMSNPTTTSMMYAVAQRGHGLLAQEQIRDYLYTSYDVQDLREEWQEYATAVEDSLSALQERETAPE